MSVNRPEIAPGITVDREQGFGVPVIKGTNVQVASILDRLASGATIDALARELGIGTSDVLAAIAYAATIVEAEPRAGSLTADESPKEVSSGVTKDPRVRFGQPVVTGTRMDIATLLSQLAAGASLETITAEYSLSPEAIRDALRYGHRLVSREKVSAS